MSLWEFFVLAARGTWIIFLVLNAINIDHYRKEAAQNYFRLGHAKVRGQYLGAIIQAAWLFGGGTWLLFDFQKGLAAFVFFAGLLLWCTARGVQAARGIERLRGLN